MDGYVPLYWDAARGRVLIEVPAFDTDVLYYVSAASGASCVELPSIAASCRARSCTSLGRGHACSWSRRTSLPSVGGSAGQVQNVKDSFATWVFAALPVEADENGRVLVDATPLFMRDAANVGEALRGTNQGAFRFDPARSGFYASRVKSFPLNAEFDDDRDVRGRQPRPAREQRDARRTLLHAAHPSLAPQGPEGYTPGARRQPRTSASAR